MARPRVLWGGKVLVSLGPCGAESPVVVLIALRQGSKASCGTFGALCFLLSIKFYADNVKVRNMPQIP